MAVWTNSDGLKVRFAREEATLNIDSGTVHEAYLDAAPSNLDSTGTVDMTSELQAALDKGGLITLTPGTYKITGTLYYRVAGTRLVGSGISSTTLNFQNGTSDGLVCDALNTCSLENIKLTGTSKTGGRLLVVKGGSYLFHVNRIYWNNAWDGLDFNEVNSASVSNSACGGSMSGDYAIRFMGSSTFKSDVLTLRSVGLSNSGGPSTFAAILWDSYAHTMELNDVRIVTAGYGILTQRTSGSSSEATPSFLNATQLEIDFPIKEAIRLNYMNDAWITNLYAAGTSTSTESGVYIANGCSSIRFTNGRVSGFNKHGIHIAGQNVITTAMRVYSNSVAGSGTYSGVYIDSTATDVVVGNSDLGKSSGETQKYGLEVVAGATRYSYGNNIINGNVTGQILPQTDLNYNAGSTYRHVFKNDAGTHLHVGGSANAPVNYFRLAGANGSGHPTMLAEGSDTNIDMIFTPKGTGTLRFGTYTAGAATDSTGYITVKDSGGTTRKLMVQA